MGWPERKKLSDFGDAELEQLVQHFKEPLSNMEVPTASFAKEMLIDEWFRLKLLGNDQSFPCLCKQAMPRPERFLVLSKLMPIVLFLSSSLASCERGFSRMNCIKTNLRLRLMTGNLESLMLIGLSGVSVENFDPNESIRLWHLSGGQKKIHMYMRITFTISLCK